MYHSWSNKYLLETETERSFKEFFYCFEMHNSMIYLSKKQSTLVFQNRKEIFYFILRVFSSVKIMGWGPKFENIKVEKLWRIRSKVEKKG